MDNTLNLDTMPVELAATVFGYLPKNDLLNVFLVNRRFTTVALPLLCERLGLRGSSPRQFGQKLRRLLQTLLVHPGLRRSVKALHMHRSLIESLTDLRSGDLTAVDIGAVINAAPVLQNNVFSQELMRQLGGPTPDAMATVLLSLIPNLQSLELRMEHAQESGLSHTENICQTLHNQTLHNQLLVYQLVELAGQPAALSSHRLFENLTKIHVQGNPGILGGAGWDSRLISLFIRLPSLRTFYGYGCWTVGQVNAWACGVQESNVEDIALAGSDLSAEAVSMLLRSCKALKKLSYLVVCCNCKQRPLFDFPKVRTALQHLKDSLSWLRLRYGHCGCHDLGDIDSVDGKFKSLAEFHALEYFETDERVLITQLDFDEDDEVPLAAMLPTSLTNFTFFKVPFCPICPMLPVIENTLLSHSELRSIKICSTGPFSAEFAREYPNDTILYPGLSCEYDENGCSLICRRPLPGGGWALFEHSA